MIEIGHSATRLGVGPTRRDLLLAGSLGVAGLSTCISAALEAAPARRETAVILYWMAGGPSQNDTWDPKPAAPAEVRGEFRAIATRVPGMSVCELLPLQAKLADKFSLVRSLRHASADHMDAANAVQTGYFEPGMLGRQQTWPAQGSMVARLAGARRSGMPPYVCIPDSYSARLGFYQHAAWLGAGYNPVNAGGEPAYRGKQREPEFALSGELSIQRVEDRRTLLRSLDHLERRVESKTVRRADPSFRRAYELLGNRAVKEAFDCSREPLALRERYGLHPWGKAALLARRLVERGVTFVTINHYEADVDWWDDHYNIMANLKRRLPLFDQALAGLIGDLHDRGMQKNVLVVACGEFGRSPRIDHLAGRGHWPRAMSALVSGGGTRPGRIIGATTADGGEPRDRPLHPNDLLATIYRVLGIDSTQTVLDPRNRPMRLIESGEAIHELFGS